MSVTLLSPRARRSGLFLAGSLALNAFLLALVAAHLLGAGREPPRPDGPLGRLVAALPEADAARARAVLDRERASYQAARERVSEMHRNVAAAIGRTPYDEAAVRDALGAWQASWQDFATRFNLAFVEMLRPLSDNGRAKLAAAALAEDARHRQAQ